MNTEKTYGPIPDREGVWEWYDETGRLLHVSVCDVGVKGVFVWLRVYYLGGYYNIEDSLMAAPDDEHFDKCEWPERWGGFVCTLEQARKLES